MCQSCALTIYSRVVESRSAVAAFPPTSITVLNSSSRCIDLLTLIQLWLEEKAVESNAKPVARGSGEIVRVLQRVPPACDQI